MGVGVAVERIPPYLSVLLVCLFALAACSFEPSVICNAPYLLNGNECCLDADTNGVCDSDEGKAAAASGACVQDCTLCPPKIIERNVTRTVTQYVCEKSGKTVDDVADCLQQRNIFSAYPLLNASSAAIVKEFSVRPACRGDAHALELHFAISPSSPTVWIESKEGPDAPWLTIANYTGGAEDKYLYGTFCENAVCAVNTDFSLPPGKAYVLRARIDYKELFGLHHFSAEVLVDATPTGPYLTKLC